MARPLRIEFAGAVYHITSRGNEKKPIYRGDEDRNFFLDILHRVNKKYNWLCHAFCLMNNHYHLVIETPDGNLSKGMRQLNGVYTQIFNKRHKRVGHVFQGRYKAILIEKKSYLLEVCRYVMLNPVRAKAVNSPGQWRWSSYRGTAGKEKPHPCLTVDWIIRQFGTKRKPAEKKYMEFTASGIGVKGIWENIRGQSILGQEDFAEKLIGYVKGYEEVKEIPKSQRYIGRPALREVFKEGIPIAKEKRNAGIKTAVVEYGYSQKEVAGFLGIHYSIASRAVNSG